MAAAKRFRQIVHYILWYCKKDPANNLSNVKLNKIIWLLDVWQYCQTGVSMTGQTHYIKRQFGPVPICILAACEQLDTQGLLQIKDVTPSGYVDIGKAQVVEPTEKHINVLTTGEKKKIRQFCDKLKSANAKELSTISHDDVYDAYQIGEKIPLEAYLLSKSVKPTAKDIQKAGRIFAL